jgi:hypothetical protein
MLELGICLGNLANLSIDPLPVYKLSNYPKPQVTFFRIGLKRRYKRVR